MACCGYWPVCKLFSVMYTDAMFYLYAWERNCKRTSTFEKEKKVIEFTCSTGVIISCDVAFHWKFTYYFFLIPYHIQKHEWINALNTVGSGFFFHIFMSFVAVLFSGHSARADTKLLTHFYTYLILCAMKRMKSKICIASCWIFATAHQIIEFSFRLCDLNYVVLWHLFRLHGPNTGQSGATNALCYASFLIHGSLCVSYRSVEVCWFISKRCGVVCVWPSICAWARIMLQYLACTQIESHSSSNTYIYMRIRSMYTTFFTIVSVSFILAGSFSPSDKWCACVTIWCLRAMCMLLILC